MVITLLLLHQVLIKFILKHDIALIWTLTSKWNRVYGGYEFGHEYEILKFILVFNFYLSDQESTIKTNRKDAKYTVLKLLKLIPTSKHLATMTT